MWQIGLASDHFSFSGKLHSDILVSCTRNLDIEL